MLTTHTPGPWTARGDDGRWADTRDRWGDWSHQLDDDDEDEPAGETLAIAVRGNDRVVALVVYARGAYEPDGPAELEANALLIAAAPDLLNVCELLHVRLFHEAGGREGPWDAPLKMLQDAIIKAKGSWTA